MTGLRIDLRSDPEFRTLGRKLLRSDEASLLQMAPEHNLALSGSHDTGPTCGVSTSGPCEGACKVPQGVDPPRHVPTCPILFSQDQAAIEEQNVSRRKHGLPPNPKGTFAKLDVENIDAAGRFTVSLPLVCYCLTSRALCFGCHMLPQEWTAVRGGYRGTVMQQGASV